MKPFTHLLIGTVGLMAMVSAACSDGSQELDARNGGAGDTGPGGGSANPNAQAPIPEGTTLGLPSVRRLTKREFESSVRDTFGLAKEWAGAVLSPEPASELGFDNDQALMDIDDDRSGQLAANAESAADAILAGKKLAGLPACAAAGPECAAAIVDTYGSRLFRREPTAEEKARYATLYTTVAGQTSKDAGLKWVLAGLIGSPSFLYRPELGESVGNGRVALSGEEIATELAFTFSGTLPSVDLLEKGRSGKLFDAATRVTEATALLETPRGQETLQDFLRQWLRYEEVSGVAKDEATVPGFAALRGAMVDETRAFLGHVVFEQKGGMKELLTSNETYVSPALATHYGLPAPGADGRVERPAGQALGILAQASILSRFGLATGTSPSQRGAFVRRKLLCQPLPPPPPNAGEPPQPKEGVTTREAYETIHAAQPSCGGCHSLIDPVGFGLESFDVAGRFRTMERGKTVDPSGKITNLGSGKSPTFADGPGLASVLSSAPEVADCVGGLLSAYAFGGTDATKHPLPESRAALRDGKGGLVGFFAAIAAAPSFAVRSDGT